LHYSLAEEIPQMTYTAADTKLQGRNHRSRKIANNTYLERRQDGVIAVRLHNTDVVTLYSDGRVVLNSGGWRTSTTAQRINSYSPVGVFQHKSNGTSPVRRCTVRAMPLSRKA
jgi:hypothetical protein